MLLDKAQCRGRHLVTGMGNANIALTGKGECSVTTKRMVTAFNLAERQKERQRFFYVEHIGVLSRYWVQTNLGLSIVAGVAIKKQTSYWSTRLSKKTVGDGKIEGSNIKGNEKTSYWSTRLSKKTVGEGEDRRIEHQRKRMRRVERNTVLDAQSLRIEINRLRVTSFCWSFSNTTVKSDHERSAGKNQQSIVSIRTLCVPGSET